ncbi:MAG: DUF86 domain-containing protein, partial [Muribaculaceae bacterium]|nr:DUF86 domain-containing protein [Muribaculaceae bacterium]
MDRNVKKFLYDIENSIIEIESFMKLRPKSFDHFCQDTMFKRAIERNIEIIGEAMNRVLKLHPEITITSSRKIVNTRNYVIHAYDTLSEEILWGIVINDLPLLK